MKNIAIAGIIAAAAIICVLALYVKGHPIVFNESFWSHAHCMRATALQFRIYAEQNGGKFPYDTNGYGRALMLMTDAWLPGFTGAGYDTKVLENARRQDTMLPESKFGRVYVQGLSLTNDPDIVLLFDKRPSPGDHCNGIRRLWAAPVREVGLIDGSMKIIPEKEWLGFSKKQIELLVQAGISPKEAERLYTLE